MSHLSENSRPLDVIKLDSGSSLWKNHDDLYNKGPAVWLFICSIQPHAKKFSRETLSRLEKFACSAAEGSIIAILTTPRDAAEICPVLEDMFKFQLWIVTKIKPPQSRIGIPRNHAALLIFSKYKKSLVHTKTRILYTYCPACNKTTKDYGGKKHTYHEKGTLMSDVWRDIELDTNAYPEDIVNRLSDLFGLPQFCNLYSFDLRKEFTSRSSLIYVKPEIEWAKKSRVIPPQHVNMLFKSDCLENLQQLPSNSIDFCFADPPYNLNKKYDKSRDSLDIIKYFKWCDTWLYELARVLKPGRTLAVLNIPLWTVRHFSYLKTILNFQDWIVWEGLSLPVRMIMPVHYSIICFSKGSPRKVFASGDTSKENIELDALRSMKELFCIRSSCIENRNHRGVPDRAEITNLWWDIHRLKHNAYRVDHPCQLPPALMRRLIALFTHKGEIVLDPFNGAGTTTLVAQQLNRKYMGIELSEKYHEIAIKRHDELSQGMDPFRKLNEIPNAKNSYVRRLKPQKYAVPKKVLQLEVKRIALKIGRMPTREEVVRLAKYPIEYYDQYFISWAEVCAAARTTGMTEYKSQSTREPELPLFRLA